MQAHTGFVVERNFSGRNLSISVSENVISPVFNLSPAILLASEDGCLVVSGQGCLSVSGTGRENRAAIGQVHYKLIVNKD